MSHDERLQELSRNHIDAIRWNFIMSTLLLVSGFVVWWLGWLTFVQVILGILLFIPPLLLIHMCRRTRMLLRFNEAIDYQRTVWFEFIFALAVVLLNSGIAIAIIVTEIFSFTTVSLLLLIITSMVSIHVDKRMKQLDSEHVTHSDMTQYKTKRS